MLESKGVADEIVPFYGLIPFSFFLDRINGYRVMIVIGEMPTKKKIEFNVAVYLDEIRFVFRIKNCYEKKLFKMSKT